ncbi:MAG: LON peptidase substrate-binding domain-containing protein [Thermoguttaceae bacterium]|jgi:ATP-dependent Lon protease
MSKFEDLSFAVEQFSGKVRLFPLPNLVLFPHVMQPLHIFEARYRDMLEDAIAGDRLVAMALLAPGWERDYEGRPPLYPVACLGRITTYFRLADGTYNVLLLGLRRIKLLYEMESNRRFREARVEIREDLYPFQEIEDYDLLHDQLHKAFLHILPFLPDAQEQLDQLTDTDVSLGMLTDIISYMLDIDLGKKQSLLTEIDVYRRTELLLKYLAAATEELEGDSTDFNPFPPLFSAN